MLLSKKNNGVYNFNIREMEHLAVILRSCRYFFVYLFVGINIYPYICISKTKTSYNYADTI